MQMGKLCWIGWFESLLLLRNFSRSEISEIFCVLVSIACGFIVSCREGGNPGADTLYVHGPIGGTDWCRGYDYTPLLGRSLCNLFLYGALGKSVEAVPKHSQWLFASFRVARISEIWSCCATGRGAMSHLPCPAVSGMNSPHKSADFFSSSAFGLLLTIPFRTVSALVVFPGYS